MKSRQPQPNFQSLSVRDLLEARDLYHYHLVNKANVVGTAIGLYLIRKNEDRGDKEKSAVTGRGKRAPVERAERRFDNSEIRDYSWPCVLVLVRDWVKEKDFAGSGGKFDPHEIVPKMLYLPDGRIVPVCVVKVTPAEENLPLLPSWHWPKSLFGGGMPIQVEVQGVTRGATAGCLLSDGHTTYALTNRHVCGNEGEPVYSIIRGKKVKIGSASKHQLTRLPFSEVYPEFPVRHTYLNLDVGLIQIDDLNDWTSQVYGIGPIGSVVDLSESNLNLSLIGADVVAHGASSGRLEGEIKGMFYRYKTVGGYEYVADFLIAPKDLHGVQTEPGDSGTVWHLAPKRASEQHRPLAVEWGGQVFDYDGASGNFHFAVATSLTNICKLLDVELVKDHNTGVMPYWGQMGHYSIASFACGALEEGPLATFMQANIDRISFRLAELDPKQISKILNDAKKNGEFCPLADVPDTIWKNFPSKVTGGRDNKVAGKGRSTGPEHPCHYADIDESRESDQKTLRELSLEDPKANLKPDFWRSFFDQCGHTQQRDRGLLPFRVWQFYDAMVEAVKEQQLDKFVCAAGILSHYVGDACQPLHGSIYSDGYKDQPLTIEHHHKDGTPYEEQSNVGAGVHTSYETAMIDRFTPQLIEGIPEQINNVARPQPVTSGFEAALAALRLMDRSAQEVPPKDLVDAFVDAGGKKVVAVYKKLWEDFGEKTTKIMADGACVLAMIWQSAWDAGKGDAIDYSSLIGVDVGRLTELYTDPEFVPSLDLDHIGSVLKDA